MDITKLSDDELEALIQLYDSKKGVLLRKKELVLPESQVLLPDLIRERCSGRTGSGNCSVPERSLRRFVRDNQVKLFCLNHVF